MTTSTKLISTFLNSVYFVLAALFLLDGLTGFEIKNGLLKSFVYIGLMIGIAIVILCNFFMLESKQRLVRLILPVLILTLIIIIGPMKILFSTAGSRKSSPPASRLHCTQFPFMTNPSNLTTTFKYKTNLKKRIIATILDYAIFLIPTYMFVMFFGQDNEEGGKTVSGLLALPIPIFWFIYFVGIESIYGATLGHQGLSLKVVTASRKETDWTQTLKRRLIDPIDIMMWGIPAIIAISNTDKHQRLGDLWANTLVVDTNDPEQYLSNK